MDSSLSVHACVRDGETFGNIRVTTHSEDEQDLYHGSFSSTVGNEKYTTYLYTSQCLVIPSEEIDEVLSLTSIPPMSRETAFKIREDLIEYSIGQCLVIHKMPVFRRKRILHYKIAGVYLCMLAFEHGPSGDLISKYILHPFDIHDIASLQSHHTISIYQRFQTFGNPLQPRVHGATTLQTSCVTTGSAPPRSVKQLSHDILCCCDLCMEYARNSTEIQKRQAREIEKLEKEIDLLKYRIQLQELFQAQEKRREMLQRIDALLE